MSTLIPVSVNYPSPLTAVPSRMQDEPTEGRKQVPIEILWGTMGGAAKCIAFNLQNNATLNISQISTLKVDNSASAADVQFIFGDTGETVTIPAGVPVAVVPVFSNATQFFVSAPNSVQGDITRAQLLNYIQPPITVAPTFERTASSSSPGVITQATNQTFQLIPVGVNGTLQDLELWLSQTSAPATPPVQFVFSVQDGQGAPNKLINSWNFALVAGTFTKIDLVNLAGINWRFVNGLQLVIQGISGTGGAILNQYASYTKP